MVLWYQRSAWPVTTRPVASSPVGGYQVLRLPFDVSNRDVKAGVALVNAGEMGVLAYLDSLFVTCDGCSVSKVPKLITVKCSSFIPLKCPFFDTNPEYIDAFVTSLPIFEDFVALEIGFLHFQPFTKSF